MPSAKVSADLPYAQAVVPVLACSTAHFRVTFS